jgi:hypothetical protein
MTSKCKKHADCGYRNQTKKVNRKKSCVPKKQLFCAAIHVGLTQ